MNNDLHIIMAVHVTDRVEKAGEVQKALSEYGCYIKTRIGLHDASENYCSTNGIILLEMLNDEKKATELEQSLSTVHGVEVRKIVFDHKSNNMISG